MRFILQSHGSQEKSQDASRRSAQLYTTSCVVTARGRSGRGSACARAGAGAAAPGRGGIRAYYCCPSISMIAFPARLPAEDAKKTLSHTTCSRRTAGAGSSAPSCGGLSTGGSRRAGGTSSCSTSASNWEVVCAEATLFTLGVPSGVGRCAASLRALGYTLIAIIGLALVRARNMMTACNAA